MIQLQRDQVREILLALVSTKGKELAVSILIDAVLHQQERDSLTSPYGQLSEEISTLFNPPGGGCQVKIYVRTLREAAEFIERLPCACLARDYAVRPPRCGRCAVLGRMSDRRIER